MKIINEKQVAIGDVIRGKNRDPWSYAFNQENGNLLVAKTIGNDYTKFKWIDAKSVLSPEDYQTAVANVNKLKAEYDAGANKSPDSADNKKSSNFNIKDLDIQYKMQVRMLEALYTMLAKEPKKYFSKYASIINDKEQEAADAWKKYCDTNIMPVLNPQLINNDNSIKRNAEQIKSIIDTMYKWLIAGSHGIFNAELTNPTKPKKYKMRIHWDYM